MKIISIIFLILFIFLTLGIIGFYFYNRNTQSIVTTNIVTSTSTSTNSYGNYKNYQYGFEIKYPSQFDVIEGTTPEHPYVDFDYKSLEPDADFEQATFSIIISTSTKDCLFEGVEGQPLTLFKDINGTRFYYPSEQSNHYEPSGGKQFLGYRYAAINNDLCYNIGETMTFEESKYDESKIKILDPILNSLVFD